MDTAEVQGPDASDVEAAEGNRRIWNGCVRLPSMDLRGLVVGSGQYGLCPQDDAFTSFRYAANRPVEMGWS